MQVEYEKVAVYEQETKSGEKIVFVAIGNGKPGAFQWNAIDVSNLQVGDWTIAGVAKKGEDGRWHVVEPFIAKKSGEEKSIDIEPERIEELCVLSENQSALTEELRRLVGVEDEVSIRGNVKMRVSVGDMEKGLYISAAYALRGDEYVPVSLKFNVHEVFKDWHENASWEFKRVDDAWEVSEYTTDKDFQVDDGTIRELFQFDVKNLELKPAFIEKLNLASGEAFSVAHGGNNTGLFKIVSAQELKDVFTGASLKGDRTLIYDAERKDVYAILTQLEGDNIRWNIEVHSKKIEKGSENVGRKLLSLMEEAIQTGSAERLREYCKNLSDEKTRALRR